MKKTSFLFVFNPLNVASTLLTFFLQNGGSGKAALAVQKIADIAQQNNSDNALLAQSYWVALQNGQYNRPSAPDNTTPNNTPTAPLFTIAPNPANNTLSLYLNTNLTSGIVNIYTLTGQLIQTHTLSNGSPLLIDSSHLPTGMYLC